MPKVSIDDELQELVARLSDLRIATPIKHPLHDVIEEQYKEASDRQEQALGKAIDQADQNYDEFTKGASAAIAAVNAAVKKIEKVSDAIAKVAVVLEVLGKLAKKLVAA